MNIKFIRLLPKSSAYSSINMNIYCLPNVNGLTIYELYFELCNAVEKHTEAEITKTALLGLKSPYCLLSKKKKKKKKNVTA